jgi:hypothetical protein
LFRAAIGKTRKLGQGRMSRIDAWYMVRWRAADGRPRDGNRLSHLPRDGHNRLRGRTAHGRPLDAKMTGLYDRNDDISVGEVERIGIDRWTI